MLFLPHVRTYRLINLCKDNFIQVYGRVSQIRSHKTILYIDIDNSIQLATLNLNLIDTFNLGDIIYISGQVIITNTGNIAIMFENIDYIVNNKTTIKQKDYFLKNNNNLITNNLSYVKKIQNRSKIINYIRSFLLEKDYLETITPILQPFASGALAKPFSSFNNHYEKDMYLRIAMECYLKRILIKGVDKVFEIGQCFRNESVSNKHNYEFTMIELYTVNVDVEYSKKLIIELFQFLYTKLDLGVFTVQYFDLFTEVSKFLNISKENLMSSTLADLQLEKYFDESIIAELTTVDQAVDYIFDKLISQHKKGFYFIENFPLSLTPLALEYKDNNRLTQSADFMFNNIELGTLYSEQNNADIQEQIFNNIPIINRDIPFLNDLKAGLPPCSGIGLGIDRIIKILTNYENIQSTMTFDFTREDFPK